MKSARHFELRAMNIGMAGNLFMGAAGILAAYLSNSQAILLDGLFSLIGFLAAYLGKRVSRRVTRQADKWRPIGYSGDEAVFATFRSLSLIGLVLFASLSALLGIADYLRGEPPQELIFEPMVVYFLFIGLTCVLLWGFHYRAWRKTGRVSDVLRIEAQAAAFDALITGSAAVGLFGVHIFRDGFLAPIAPVGDSIVVLFLCVAAVSQYYRDFMSGLGELAGVTAHPRHIATVRRSVRPVVQDDAGALVDLSVSKFGRQFLVIVYYNPMRPITAAHVDAMARKMERACATALAAGVDLTFIVSEHGRVLPGVDGETEVAAHA
ncbi:cation transporter [Defluviimonas salinarum]|uniref:Cation transporter n=1 Tax=Defluviimonas salinarum TaxID=2992147 RepID=A0ABT3J876_9RHOB|nr:cation transporter [Defluviimonas salinarum]MCW3783625.1 cation transporter [Defluviimonas salinarum]